jgi:hypothetical protein
MKVVMGLTRPDGTVAVDAPGVLDVRGTMRAVRT